MWGVYKLAVEMCKHARFLETEVDLMYEGKMVGRILVRAKKPGNPDPELGVVEERDEGYSRLPTASQNKSTDLNFQHTNELSTDFASELLTQWHQSLENQNTTTTATLPTINTTTLSQDNPRVIHDLIPIPKGANLGRNAVFLTVFAGLLHIAQFRPNEQMVDFEADSPAGDVSLMVARTRLSCSVRLNLYLSCLVFLVAMRI